jgi:ribosome biogenesis GTPase A
VKERLDKVVQWYPGHMVRAMRRIGEYLKLIDIVIEVIDARAPRSDANPMLDELIGSRERIVVLSRDDLADPHVTPRWVQWFAARGREAIAAETRQQQSVSRILAAVTALAKKRSGLSRVIVVGVPNSGKSSVINGLLKRAAAKTEDRAGVTRQLQWFRLGPTIELMDSPGILVPKIETAASQWKLALIGRSRSRRVRSRARFRAPRRRDRRAQRGAILHQSLQRGKFWTDQSRSARRR